MKTKHPLYWIWRAMLGRCKYKSDTGYKHYGGRGIRVCKRWMKFENFLKDMGKRPTPKHTLERKNFKGNYTPKNCIWATQKAQQRNKGNNRLITFKGKTQCVSAWAEELNMGDLIQNRLDKGWSGKRALTTPKKTPPTFEFRGKKATLKQWSKASGIAAKTIWFRLSKGWTIEKALTTKTLSKSESGKMAKGWNKK